MIYDCAIVGAGLSGALISYHLSEKDIPHIIIDKGRGMGGRLSTRRLENTFFNHGSQVISFNEYENQKWFQNWVKNGWLRKRKSHWSIETSSSTLVKSLVDIKNVVLNEEISEINDKKSHLELKSLNRKNFSAKKIILTAPLPQSAELADKWLDLDSKSKISTVVFFKKIIFFVKNKKLLRFSTSSDFSIESKQNDHMITFSDDISAYFFESSNTQIISSLLSSLTSYMENLEAQDIEIKKWRFAQPLNSLATYFFESLDKKVYLAGDGFCSEKNSSTEKVLTSVYKLLMDSDLLS